MSFMATNRSETHVWFDGEWHAYTERLHDFERFTDWFGPPTRGASREHVGHWGNLGPNALKLRRPIARRVLTEAEGAALAARLAKSKGP